MMIFNKLWIFLFVLGMVNIACSTSRPDTINSNEQISYVSGTPNFTVSSFGTVDGDQIKILVTTSILPSSLISVANDSIESGTEAVGVFVEFEINSETSDSKIASRNVKKELTIDRDERRQSEDLFKFTEEFEIESPGTYNVIVSIIDLVSGKREIINSRVIIPDPDAKVLGLSNTLMKQKMEKEEGFSIVTGYNINADKNYIEFENNISNDVEFDSITVYTKLIKFESDLDPAKKLGAPSFSVTVLDRNGIQYNNEEILSEQRRVIKLNDEVLSYKIGFETPDIGNYRYLIQVKNENGEELTRAFDFGVKSEEFPYVRTPEQLAESLVYLMNEDEYEDIMSIANMDSLKKAVDDFWLRNIQNIDKAEKTIEIYYQRVEEANKRFTSYKEGWKTDQGMIYILFGPPMFSRTTFNFIHWSYSTDRYSDRYNYFFNKERRPTREFPFTVYLLDRSNNELNNNEYLIVQKWLTGNIEN